MDSNAVFVGSFAVRIGIQTALCAEVMAAIFAIEMASSKNLYPLWLESDSSLLDVQDFSFQPF